MDFKELFGVPQAKWGDSALYYIHSGGDLNEHHSETGWTLLHIAVEFEELDVIRLAVSRGADINAQDVQGWTPLHHAVDSDIDSCIQQNQPITMPTVKLLLELGADDSILTNKNETPRDIAKAYWQQNLYDALK
jgi:ankyrin repeat protein